MFRRRLSPLTETESHLANPDLSRHRVCPMRDDKTYHEGHPPGAMWVYWKAARCAFEFVHPAAMAHLYGGMGIGPQSTLVLCDAPLQYGSYAFWASAPSQKTCGCSTAGGENGSQRGGRCPRNVPRFPLTPPPAPAGTPSMRVGRCNVHEEPRQPRRLLLDAHFAPEEFTGKRVSEIFLLANRGAVHLYFGVSTTTKFVQVARPASASVGGGRRCSATLRRRCCCYCRLSHAPPSPGSPSAWRDISTTARGPNGRVSATLSRSSEPADLAAAAGCENNRYSDRLPIGDPFFLPRRALRLAVC